MDYPHSPIPIALCMLRGSSTSIIGLLHATPTKDFTDTLLYMVMLDDPLLMLLENDDQEK